MITISKEVRTETAHRLLDYYGKCAHVHGHSYRWVLECIGSNEDAIEGTIHKCPGMLIDFSWIGEWMDSNIVRFYDHALVLWDKDPLIGCTKQLAPQCVAEDAPLGSALARLRMLSFNPTAENLAMLVGNKFEVALQILPPGVITFQSLTVWETPTSFARYTPAK